MKMQRRYAYALACFALILLACDLTVLTGVATKPTVTIVSPPSGARANAGSEVEVQSVVTDAQGIARVELWVDGAIVRTDALPAPQTTYAVVQRWTATTPGAHIVQVCAYNATGAASGSAAISVEVMPAVAQATPSPPAPLGVIPTPIAGASPPSSPASPAPTARSAGRLPNPTTVIRKPATPFAPADVAFHIDCSALDPSWLPDCNIYLANTRDLVYPILRDLTGTSLASCYDAVYYKIVPDEQLSTHQGEANQNRILYSLRGTLNFAPLPLYDSHEILHTISTYCNHALDNHVFHSAIESYIDLTLTGTSTWHYPNRDLTANWLEKKLIPDIRKNLTPPPDSRHIATDPPCARIFGDLVLILYYDSGIDAIKQLYRATINPDPKVVPNAQLSSLFGPQARQYQIVVNALKQNTRFQIAVPECGY